MDFIQDNGDLCLALLTLILAFVFKLVVDRSLCRADFLSCLCDLPVDLIFTGLAFFIAYTISDGNDIQFGINLSFGTIILAAFAVVLGRRSDTSFKTAKPFQAFLMLSINLFLGLTILVYSVTLFTGKEKPKGKPDIVATNVFLKAKQWI